MFCLQLVCRGGHGGKALVPGLGPAQRQQAADRVRGQSGQQPPGLEPGRVPGQRQTALRRQGADLAGLGAGTAQPGRSRHSPRRTGRDQQGRQPDQRVGGQGVHDPEALPVRSRLQPGQDLSQDLERHPAAGPAGGQQLVQLLPDPLGRNAPQPLPLLQGGRRGGGVEGQFFLRAEAVQPQDAQPVLLKAAGRLAHRAHHPADQQVLPAPKGVDEALGLVVGHGVDGKIPPGQVGLHIGHELHPVGVASVGIAALHPEGGHFIKAPALPDGDGAVLQPGGDAVLFPKERHRLLRPCAGADVPVVRGAAGQAVPDAAAHQIGFVSRPVQFVQHLRCAGVYVDLLVHVSVNRRVTALPSKPHSAAGNTACARGRAASGSSMRGE